MPCASSCSSCGAQVVRDNYQMAQPAFELQRAIRRKVLGVKYWEKMTQQRTNLFASYDEVWSGRGGIVRLSECFVLRKNKCITKQVLRHSSCYVRTVAKCIHNVLAMALLDCVANTGWNGCVLKS